MTTASKKCPACLEPINVGDRCLADIELDVMHFDCCGPERESYVNLETGEPIGPDEPLPVGWIWTQEDQDEYEADQ